jgi:hypothetical protein
MVFLRNICINTLHKGDSIFTYNNNSNNSKNNSEHFIQLVVFKCLSSLVTLIVTLSLVKWMGSLILGPKLIYVCRLQLGDECNVYSIQNIVTSEIIRSTAKCAIISNDTNHNKLLKAFYNPRNFTCILKRFWFSFVWINWNPTKRDTIERVR